MGWSDAEIEHRIRRAFVDSNPLGDYVLPVVALTRGKRVDERLAEHFGDTRIEDLPLPFFCVSTDLAKAKLRVHRTGLLREALRASIALPGILPPVVDGESLLVDGAVLRNFPVDVMRDLYRGPIIGVDVARRSHIDPADFLDPPPFVKWVRSKGLQSAPPIATLLIRAATLTVDPWEGRAATDILITPDMPGVDLRDWKRFARGPAAARAAAPAGCTD
jgi:NTE family protein